MTQHPKDLLNEALKEAMKAKDNQRRDVLRLLTSAIKQVEIDGQKELSPDDVMNILQREAKKRRESIVEYGKADRPEQVAEEQYELELIESFLPRQLTHDEVTAIVKEVLAETGVTSAKEMGKVMGVLQPRVKGLADGKVVSEIVKSLLG